MTPPADSLLHVRIARGDDTGLRTTDDVVAVEEPLELQVTFGPEGDRTTRSLAITMRTPGHDFELAAGFLFGEKIVSDYRQIDSIGFRGPPAPGRESSNTVRVVLAPGVELDLKRLQRNFFATSSCGICGKASLDALELRGIVPPADGRPQLSRQTIGNLPRALRSGQELFELTGGTHAAGLFDDGRLALVREDVGRHNAVDKLIGRKLLDDEVPLSDTVLAVSGRASFEIVQKALIAGVPALVAVGAPSSLAVELARQFELTLIGFASGQCFNVYAGARRIID